MTERFESRTRVALAADRLAEAMSTPADQEAAARFSGATEARARVVEQTGDHLLMELYTETPARRGGGLDRATIEMHWDLAARTCRWRRIDHRHGDRVRTEGEIRIEPEGVSACRFIERGEIEIEYPLLGPRIAKKLAAAIERRAPDRMQYWEERLTAAAG